MTTDDVKITDELEVWHSEDGRVGLHVEVLATEGPEHWQMFGEVDVPDVAALVHVLLDQLTEEARAELIFNRAADFMAQPVVYRPEPVTHEATDPELWDTDVEIYVLACTCGTWETRGTTAEITAAFEAHLDAEGVPANDLAQLEADQREARTDTLAAVRALRQARTWPRTSALMKAAERLALTIPANSPGAGEEITITPGPELAAAIAAQEVPEMIVTEVTPYNWNPVIIATLATQTTDPADKTTAYDALHKAQRQLVAEILAEPVESLASVAKALRISVGPRTPRELAIMAVATILHRERVKNATELSRAVSQLPEILATAAPELRSALRTMLADAADALAEPDPATTTGTAAAMAYMADRYAPRAGRSDAEEALEMYSHTYPEVSRTPPHQIGGRCWCRVAHSQAEAIELNRRAGF